ncbi:hypothetical protein Taro_011846 [Colocasia esculenta]|uniref:Subtilisin-like protease n=1 Tax=Colocasia esculenta TaxID=4460 RepID=A0A843U705_COLES|nr:hypothetical protein [Colocasia esculenta]
MALQRVQQLMPGLESRMVMRDSQVDQGSLSWVDEQRKHVVRSPIVAATHNLHDDDDDWKTSTYIVHMDKSAMPVAFSDHGAWYTAALSAAAHPTADTPRPIYVYDNAVHGFSARLSGCQLQRLKSSPGFLSAHRDFPVQLHTTHTPEFLGLSAASGIWPGSRYGQGAIIGIVDTGVWPESESFKDVGMPRVPARWRGVCEEGDNFTVAMCNRKLIGARYFNRGLLAEDPNLTISVKSARDTVGHGTHTASTAAGSPVKGANYFGYGNGTARGVAPRAHLAVYKVLWSEGSSASDVLAGIDQAIADGVDVISLSLSYGNIPLHENPLAVAAFAAMEKGIFVATTAGNDGPSFKSISRGVPWALTVGASTVDRQFAGTVVLGDGTAVDGGSLYVGARSTRRLRLAFVDNCEDDAQLAENKNSIIVCVGLADDDYLSDLEIAVRDAKLPGAIFISHGYYLEQFAKFSFPATFVAQSAGARILDYLNKTSKPTARLLFGRTVLGTKPAPAVAEYSSRGPSLSCPDVLKPDLVAPGSLVLASYTLSNMAPAATIFSGKDKFSPFNVLYGTSMACPHAAGVAAMLRVLHPDWSAAAIRSAMMTTASTTDSTGDPISDPINREAASPLAMGSGQIDPNRALDPGLVYDAGVADYTRFLCAMNYTTKQILTIVRSKTKLDCTTASLDLNYPSIIAFFDSDDSSTPSGNGTTVRVFRRTVTNVADGAWAYTAKVTEMDGFRVSVKPHRLVFRGKGEKQSFTVTVVGHRTLSGYDVVHGRLSWVDQQGKHVVKSPIVATTRNIFDGD